MKLVKRLWHVRGASRVIFSNLQIVKICSRHLRLDVLNARIDHLLSLYQILMCLMDSILL